MGADAPARNLGGGVCGRRRPPSASQSSSVICGANGAANHLEEIVYREELEVLERSNPNFHVLYTLTRPVPGSWKGRTGRIGVGADLLTEAAAGLDRPVYYLCGAP